jgi:hypothetical protein
MKKNLYLVKTEYPSDDFIVRASSVENVATKIAELRGLDVLVEQFTGVFLLQNTVTNESMSIFIRLVGVIETD